jgi:hypothetical protein
LISMTCGKTGFRTNMRAILEPLAVVG